MTESFTSISATFDYKTIRTLVKTGLLCILFIILGIEVYTSLVFNHIHLDLWWHIVFIVPAGVYNFVQIMGYSRYDIIRLRQNTSKKQNILEKIIDSLKTIFYHGIELILIPSFVCIMLFLSLTSFMDVIASLTILFVAIYFIQILPLKIKQNQYIKMAYAAILNARDEIKTTRILITMDALTKDERKIALERHIMAEEMISINSSFFFVSTSTINTLIGGIRYLLPIAGTVFGFLLDMGLI